MNFFGGGTGAGNEIINEGVITAVAGGPLEIAAATFSNEGTVEATAGGTLQIDEVANYANGTLTGGTWRVLANSTLSLNIPDAITTNCFPSAVRYVIGVPVVLRPSA